MFKSGIEFHVPLGVSAAGEDVAFCFEVWVEAVFCIHFDLSLQQSRGAGAALALPTTKRNRHSIHFGHFEQTSSSRDIAGLARPGKFDSPFNSGCRLSGCGFEFNRRTAEALLLDAGIVHSER